MKLGLIALSGVRVCNQELLALGLTLPGFVERSKVIASLPSLGLLTLGGMTPADVSVEYLEVPDLEHADDLSLGFDAVAISSYTAQIRDAYSVADRYRSQGIKVILGGPHVTAMPYEARSHADSVVLGEGELAWKAVLHDLTMGDLQAVYDVRGGNHDLADAPMPRFDLLDIERYNRLTVQTQRGCPYNCDFCASSRRISAQFKVKPVEKVIAEIRNIKSLWNRPFIEFADDNTFANKAHGKRLLRALIPEKIRWFTETDISIAEDDELLQLLRDSGCAQVLIGLESPRSSFLDGIEKKSNWKSRQVDNYLSAIDKIQGSGVTVNGCFIMGLDGADPDSFQEVIEFVKQSALYEVQVTIQTAFPGTPLYERLKASGRLLNDTAWDTCTLFDVNFLPQNMTVQELEQNFRVLMKELYNEEFTAWRRRMFRQRLKEARREGKPPSHES
ncbi:MAG TPA: radical SAM protein [Nitrospirota bacterium]|nr:radical SAM protein [Nitrospirota bacterium]